MLHPRTTAAHDHALTRLTDGFSINQVAAEFRALRSSVIRLWMGQTKLSAPAEIDDMIRFNEAINQEADIAKV